MRAIPTFTPFALAMLLMAPAGCGDDTEACDPSKADACPTGQVCELVSGSHASCFPETVITGRVFDATSPPMSIAGARVVAIDGATNAAASNVSITDVAGKYRVVVHLPRSTNAANDVKNASYTLRVSVEKYQDFPSPIRQAIPIDVRRADDPNALPSNVRDVALLPIPGADAAQLGSIGGRVLDGGAVVGGALVVAQDSAGKAVSAVSDTAGNYVILNLPAGTYELRGYIAGKAFAPVSGLALAAGEDKGGVDLHADAGAQLSRLTGGIQIVNGQTSTTETLIVLALASTHEVPAGLSNMTVATRFDIGGIPPGSYDILASYNNDDLVLDPDPSQLPRPIRVNLPADAPGGALDAGSFKVTGDVGIIGPGTGVPDEPAVAAAGLTFRWMDDSSEDFYGIEVLDAFGSRIWGSEPSATIEPTVLSAKNTTSMGYGGPPLVGGQFYQWRITSYKCLVSATPCTSMKPISASENLRGVFQVAP